MVLGRPGDSEDDSAERVRQRRVRMVERQLVARGVEDASVLAAMREIPRHLFVPEGVRPGAYSDRALPIGEGQTISQPLMVALALQALELTGREHALDVGTGSGYQVAVMARLVADAVSVEVIPELAARAEVTLASIHAENVQVVVGDGSDGWPAGAPYTAIAVAAAAPAVPPPLIDQLEVGGRLVLPVGESRLVQTLVRVRKTRRRVYTERLVACAYVPLVGAHGWPARER